jgi:single-strand DNA-binding protein
MTAATATRERETGRASQYLITATAAKEITMRDIATATLSGNLTREVELRQLPSGAAVARLRIATTTRRRSGEQWVDKTNYFTVEVYGGHARACAEHLGTSSRVVVDAELDWREWTDPDNRKREAVTFRARQVLFEGARSTAAGANDGSDQHPGPPATGSVADASPVGASAPSSDATASAEDLPF